MIRLRARLRRDREVEDVKGFAHVPRELIRLRARLRRDKKARANAAWLMVIREMGNFMRGADGRFNQAWR